eukprot:TRINITY_DN17081_c0_g1_i2.p3 TRINITY_DN17081_c0_g1~~TRINITY_DN17081_c0_g1_i2.p3  ORF type:complete len:100 (+),score=40.65 TRINITY_DN17081_c0_g1_i2:123-422(+)
MIRRPPRSTQGVSSAASDVYKRQILNGGEWFKKLGVAGSAGTKVFTILGDINEKGLIAVSYTHLRAHETSLHLVCRLLLEKKKKKKQIQYAYSHLQNEQ